MSQLSFSSFDDALLVRDAQGRYLPASVDQILEAAQDRCITSPIIRPKQESC